MRRRASNRSRWLVTLSVLLVGLVVVVAIAAALVPALLPADDRIGGEGRSVAAGVIFVGSYLALAVGRIPGLSIDRAGIALVGAGLMVASGALPLEDAYKAVDLDTITLLLGMMIVVASLRLSGFFAVANAWVIAHARRPLILLGAVIATSDALGKIERVSEMWNLIRFSSFMVSMGIWCFALRKPLPAPAKEPVLLPAEVYRELSPALNLRLRAFNDRLQELLKT